MIVAWEQQNVRVPVLAVCWDRPVARDNTGLEGDVPCSNHHAVLTGCLFGRQGGHGAAVALLRTASTLIISSYESSLSPNPVSGASCTQLTPSCMNLLRAAQNHTQHSCPLDKINKLFQGIPTALTTWSALRQPDFGQP